jgi:RNA-directed DNA polymerase
MLPLHPRVEGIMHKQVHEHRANNNALRRTLLAWNRNPILRFEGRFQPALNVQQHPTIFDVRSHRFHREIEERYAQHVWPRADGQRAGARGRPTKALIDPTLIGRRACANRANDRLRGLSVFMPIRYADDFIVVVAAADGDPEQSRAAAEQEKLALGNMLTTELGLTLSP